MCDSQTSSDIKIPTLSDSYESKQIKNNAIKVPLAGKEIYYQFCNFPCFKQSCFTLKAFSGCLAG